MASHGYFDVFPDKAKTELRTATFADCGGKRLPPDGKYLFTEYYCTDLNCNCQRVLVKVLYAHADNAPLKDVATISYTWNENSDETWSVVNSDTPNPFLDPFHPRAPFADELLDFWRDMVECDRAYAARLKRHYDEIRAKIGRYEDDLAPSGVSSTGAKKTPFRPLTKQERTARNRRLARARKRK